MPKQSPLRIIKRWRAYERRGDWKYLRPISRGVYVLYKEQKHRSDKIFFVVYIGVAGVAKDAKTGINGRLQQHARGKKDWTHYSFFEVHDNIAVKKFSNLRNFFWLSFGMILVSN